MVDTKKVPRRTVQYHSLDEIVADAERLVTAGAATTGNWSVGQILVHIANVMDMSIDGTDVKAPWWLRFLLGTLMKKRMLAGKMPAGFKLPAKAEAQLVSPEVDAQTGLERLKAAVARLKQETHREPSPIFGPMDVAQWNQLHCRHSELHMSFISEPG